MSEAANGVGKYVYGHSQALQANLAQQAQQDDEDAVAELMYPGICRLDDDELIKLVANPPPKLRSDDDIDRLVRESLAELLRRLDHRH